MQPNNSDDLTGYGASRPGKREMNSEDEPYQAWDELSGRLKSRFPDDVAAALEQAEKDRRLLYASFAATDDAENLDADRKER